MNNFERIAKSAEVLAAFLASLPIAEGPWDTEFHKIFCNACQTQNCDGANCQHNAERNSPLWWLEREAD